MTEILKICRPVEVTFYFNQQNPENMDERLEKARSVLKSAGADRICERVGETTREELVRGVMTPTGMTTVHTLRAYVPEANANMHHGFESRLNKAYPEGAGAGFVGNFAKNIDYWGDK